MTILKVTYGNPVASIKGICEHYQISDRTARMIVKELEQERGRYGDYTVLGDGALKRVNFLAFTDYWQFRKMLQDKNARKHVPVYSPQKWTPEVFERTEAILYYQGGDIFNTLRRELLPEEYEAFDRAFCNHFRPDLTELADWIGRKRKEEAWKQKKAEILKQKQRSLRKESELLKQEKEILRQKRRLLEQKQQASKVQK